MTLPRILGASLLAVAATCACGGSSETEITKGDPTGNIQIAGTWHDCGSRLSLKSDGTFELARFIASCTESGSYAIAGDAVTLDFASSDCKEPSTKTVYEAVLVPPRLFLASPERTQTYYADSVPRSRFELSGQGKAPPATGESVVRIVGDPSAPPFSACYFSSDGACGGFLSCGGAVDVWQLTGTSFVAKLGCQGSCPCAAILKGSAQADASIAGTFSAMDCSATWDGSFVLKPAADP